MVQNINITVSEENFDDYICITDIAKAKVGESRGADVVKNWIRNRSTLVFLGTWEKIYNPAFKVVEFDHFKSRIIDLLPCTQKYQCRSVSYPVFYNICSPGLADFGFCNISNADIIVKIFL